MLLTATKNSFITFYHIAVKYGEPFVFPTDTIYGIGSPILSTEGNRKIFELKDRPIISPLPILAGSIAQVETIAVLPKGEQRVMLEALWNSVEPHTIVLKSNGTLVNGDFNFTVNDTVAVRLVQGGWLRDALAATGPVTATSINKSGKPPLGNIIEIQQGFPEIRYFLEGNVSEKPSKIIDFTIDSTRYIRN